MKKYNKIIYISILIIFFLGFFYFNRQSLYSHYIQLTVNNFEEVKEYKGSTQLNIIGEEYGNPSLMQLDNNNTENRKKVSVQYHCSILCTIDKIAIDPLGDNNRNIIYGDSISTDWVENWG